MTGSFTEGVTVLMDLVTVEVEAIISFLVALTRVVVSRVEGEDFLKSRSNEPKFRIFFFLSQLVG